MVKEHDKLFEINYIIPFMEFRFIEFMHTLFSPLPNITSQNIVGSALKRMRRVKKLSQAMLAARCAILGWDISQNTITKIENGFRCVADYELLTLSRALKLNLMELLPENLDLTEYLKNRVGKKVADLPGLADGSEEGSEVDADFSSRKEAI